MKRINVSAMDGGWMYMPPGERIKNGMDGRSGDGWMLMACLRENKQSRWMNGRMDANAVLKRG